jgi:hypothetical protein
MSHKKGDRRGPPISLLPFIMQVLRWFRKKYNTLEQLLQALNFIQCYHLDTKNKVTL